MRVDDPNVVGAKLGGEPHDGAKIEAAAAPDVEAMDVLSSSPLRGPPPRVAHR